MKPTISDYVAAFFGIYKRRRGIKFKRGFFGDNGVYISDVTGKNAKKAGLQKGDLIYYLDDTKITSSAQLVGLIQKHEVGDVVTFTVVRDNELLKMDVELELSQPQQPAQQSTEG